MWCAFTDGAWFLVSNYLELLCVLYGLEARNKFSFDFQ